MPALKPTRYAGEVVWLGRVADRDGTLRSAADDALELRFEGVVGEAHAGLTRPSCARVTSQHPRGTPIRNVRQVTIVAAEELDAIAVALGLDALDPAVLGAQIVLRGLPDLSHLPPSSRLQAPSGATLAVDMANRPCHLPAREIERDRPGYGARFREAAAGRRGVTACVDREGRIALGDGLRLHVPDQPVWPHLEAARTD